jgi:hypothetical protein
VPKVLSARQNNGYICSKQHTLQHIWRDELHIEYIGATDLMQQIASSPKN